ncbi:MAG: LamG domain-containing protein [archaeon]
MGLKDGLVSYYELEETSGTTITDAHASNDGTVDGATLGETGKIGKSYLFESEDNADFSSLPNIENDDFSVSFWIKINSYASSTSNQRILIFGHPQDGSNENNFYFWHQNPNKNNTFHFTKLNDSGDNYTTSVSLDKFPTGTWVHVVGTFNKTDNEIKLYVDGNLEDTTSTSGTFSTTSDNISINKQSQGGWNDNEIDANIDEIGIWDRALSSSEVSELYNNGDGLAYPFDTGEIFEADLIRQITAQLRLGSLKYGNTFKPSIQEIKTDLKDFSISASSYLKTNNRTATADLKTGFSVKSGQKIKPDLLTINTNLQENFNLKYGYTKKLSKLTATTNILQPTTGDKTLKTEIIEAKIKLQNYKIFVDGITPRNLVKFKRASAYKKKRQYPQALWGEIQPERS